MTDAQERAQAALEGRIERARVRLRQAEVVLSAHIDGLGLSDTARRLGSSRQTAWRYQVWLGLAHGGRLDSLRALREVRT